MTFAPVCQLRLTRYEVRSGIVNALVFLFFASTLPSAGQQFGKTPQWQRVSIRAARHSGLFSPQLTRQSTAVDTCMYDAWAAYDAKAVGTQLGRALRRPPVERTLANKQHAISYAAYRALTDLFPADTESVYMPLMKDLGSDPKSGFQSLYLQTLSSSDIETPAGIGNVACAAVLEFRHHDKSNQLGDLAPNEDRDLAHGPYSDWANFHPANRPLPIPIKSPIPVPGTVLDPSHWQPLSYVDSRGNLVTQMFAAHWCFVTPFALTPPSNWQSPADCPYTEQFRALLAPGPAKFGDPEYETQARELINLSANLTDRQKVLAEFWTADGKGEDSVTRWFEFANFIAERDHMSLDDQIKLNFALSNALMDTEIAVWDAKRAYNSVRPITAITFLYNGKKIPNRNPNTPEIDGSQWLPYQPITLPTPPSPDFVSEESAVSAAAARILTLFTGSDRLDYSVTIPKGSSRIEPGATPREDITLHWDTFSQAADEAGMATRYAGMHFRRSDLAGRALGRAVADLVWAKANSYFNGTAPPIVPQHPAMPTPTP